MKIILLHTCTLFLCGFTVNIIEQSLLPKNQTKPFYIGTQVSTVCKYENNEVGNYTL